MLDDDDSHNGGQKGSFWDWLLTFFLIRKSNKKKNVKNKKNDELENVEEVIKPITIIPMEEPVKKVGFMVDEPIKKVGVSEIKSNTKEDTELSAATFMKAFITIDNYLKVEHPNEEKVANLIGDISKLIKKQLKKCKEDLDKLEVKIDEAIKKEEVDKLQKELNDIYNKIILLRDRVESLRNGKFYNYDLEEDHKIMAKVKDLSNFATRDEILNIMHLCDEKLVTIMEFMRTEEKKQGIAETLNDKKSNINVRDQHFTKSKKKYSLVKDAESILLMAINEQNDEIRRIKEEMARLEPSIRVITHMQGFGNIFSNTLKIAFGILSLPLSGTKSKLFGTMLIGNSIKGLQKGLSFKDEKIVYYEYSKFNYTISSTVSRLNGIDYMLTNALTDLKDLKIDYTFHFKEYQHVLPEYAEFIKKIESLEEKIIKEREKVQNMVKKIEAQKKQDKVLKKVAA